MSLEMETVVTDFASAIQSVDQAADLPPAINARSGERFKPGIGPYQEQKAVDLIIKQLQSSKPEAYSSANSARYPSGKEVCDLLINQGNVSIWAIEIKLLRMKGDNGKPNDNMITHMLSPYHFSRSALTDCEKLLKSGFTCRKGILIYAFDYPDLPSDPVIDAFELLARSKAKMSPRSVAIFAGLIHPEQNRGRVFGWEIKPLAR